MKDYLEISKKILKISGTPDSYAEQDFDAALFAEQSKAAALIAIAEKLADIGATLVDMHYSTAVASQMSEFRPCY